jgi:hypothetical protein
MQEASAGAVSVQPAARLLEPTGEVMAETRRAQAGGRETRQIVEAVLVGERDRPLGRGHHLERLSSQVP